MKRNDHSALKLRSSFSIFFMIGVCAAVLGFSGGGERVAAALFPTRISGDDVMTSMGVFKVVVAPPFRSLLEPDGALSGYPGYVSGDGRLTSPLLFDPNTRVGRSDPYNRPLGGLMDVGAPSMGLQGYGDYPIIPPLFSTAPAGTRELLTRIRNLALSTTSESCSNLDPRVPHPPINYQFVSAGPDQGIVAKSVGIVQRGPTAPVGSDFPARSFFDIFVEVNLPAVPGTVSGTAFPPPGAILYNDFPLVITNLDLAMLPPHVIYMHVETTAVPLKFRDSNPPYWNAGDVFGYLVLAGHGTQFNCQSEAGTFLDTVLGPIGGRPSNEMPIEWPFPTDLFPPANATYDSVKMVDVIGFTIPGAGRVLGRNFSHGRLDNPIVPPPLNGTTDYTDGTELLLELSLDNGVNWQPSMSTGPVTVRLRHTADMGDLHLFDTEMLSLSLTGNSPAGPYMLRESPTLASTGKHTIRDTGGDFLISSFFDVYLELSVDGGVNWIPARETSGQLRPIRLYLTPGCETNRPSVLNVSADCDQNTITVHYSEAMDPVTTGNPGNYILLPGGSISSVTMNAAGDSAVLTTSDLFCDKSYELHIRGVADKCGNVILPSPTIVSITCPPCKVSKWSQLPGFLLSPPGVDPNRRGADRPSDFDWVTLMKSGTTLVDPNWVIAEDFRSDGRPILCVRWWGSYMPGFEPGTTTAAGVPNTFFEDGYVLSFFTSTPPGGAPSRPDQLLGTYVAPLPAIKITPTRFIGCDSNRIWQYEVKLEDTCLEHADPVVATPKAFLERSNVVYWLAITAEVGHRVVPLIDPAGNVAKWEEELTGKRADKHFWGWHTSPLSALNPSEMGHVYMQGTNWIYPITQWMPNSAICNERDQAFELLTLDRPCETNPPTVISVIADCDHDKITVTYSEAMDPSTVGDPGNYGLSGGASINSIVLNPDASIACLYTTDLKCGTTNTLTIRSVADVCQNVIRPNPQSFTFICPPCPEPKVAKWSQLPGFLLAPPGVDPNRRGADRPSDFDWTALMQSGTAIGHPNWVIAEDFRSDGRPILCVRWWGSYLPGFEPSQPPTLAAVTPPRFFEDGYVLSFFTSVQPVGPGAPSRPGQLLGTYVAPLSSIKITPTRFIGCDSNRIWQYEVRLEDTCLDHADPRIATPKAFLEQTNIVYWLAITAEVGHQVIPITDNAGNIIDWRHQPTGKRADRHFWGWHTSPKQEEERSEMGHVLMQGTNWIYPPNLWMLNQIVCQEIDQAFELLTNVRPPCETNPPTVISVTADCDSNKVTVVYSEPMDPVSAGNPGSYAISGGVGIITVTLNIAGDTAVLMTTDLACGNNYTVSVRNVRDLCNNLIVPNPQSITFTCPPCPQPKVAKWSQLPGYLTSTVNPHRRGADRPSDFDWNLIMQNPGTIIQPNWVIADDFLSDGRPILCVRWWGSYFKGYEPVITGSAGPQFFEDGYVLSFFTGFIGGIDRPDKLLGTYVAPLESVKITPTPFFGCDSNRIFQYEVALKDTCLDHRFAGIARPTAFLERSNDYYFLAITAEVGHRVIPLRNNQGQIVDWAQKATDKRAQEHFWGWHTSPSNRLDVSVMGNVLMDGQSWIYTRWMRNDPICDEIDQAFQLLTGPIVCPPPATLSIVRDGDNVVISWVGDFTLQGTPALASPSLDTEWTDVTTSSPAILPIVFTEHRFFRLICP